MQDPHRPSLPAPGPWTRFGTPILIWGLMGWALGLATAAETSFVNPMRQVDFDWGYSWVEINAVFFSHMVIAGLGMGLLLGVAASVLVALATPRGADTTRLHLALAGASLAFWLLFAPTLQSGALTWKLAAPLAAIGTGGLILLVASWVRRSRPALKACRALGLTALVCMALTSLTSTSVFAVNHHWGPVEVEVPMADVEEAGGADPATEPGDDGDDVAVDVEEAARVSRFPPVVPPLPRSEGAGRVIVLAIDGLDWTLLDPLIEQGRTPNFERIRREGVSAVLETLVPGASPRIWTTVATGVSPERHGVLWFDYKRYPELDIHRTPEGEAQCYTGPILDLLFDGWRGPASSEDRRVKAIWNLCAEADIPVGISGWWGTWPPEPVPGWMVTDHAYYGVTPVARVMDHGPAARETKTWPPELIDELVPFRRRLAQATLMDVAPFADLDEEDLEAFNERITASDPDYEGKILQTMVSGLFKDEYYAESALYLNRQQPPELLMAYLSSVDWFGHEVYEHSQADEAAGLTGADAEFHDSMDAVVAWMDGWVGRFLDVVDDDTTLVILSDHGFTLETWGGHEVYHHREGPPGILLAYGNRIRSGVELHAAHVYDVMPTLMYLLGLPLAEDLEGQLLTEALQPDPLAAWPPTFIGSYDAPGGVVQRPISYSSDDDAEMLARLKALGYVK